MWRSFDVGSVVRSLPMTGAVVAAGTGGMHRKVSRARPAATADDLRHVAAGDLVVTAATTLLDTGEEAERLIARLDAAQIAGLAVRLDVDGGLPPAVLGTADRVDLPILTFARDNALNDVTALVLDALLEAQRRRLQHVLDIHQRFARIIVAGGGTPELASTLHDLVGRPVAVLDREGQPRVIVPSDADIAIDPDGASVVRHPIRAGDQTYGAVIVDAGPTGLDGDGMIAMERAAMGVAIRLAQATAVAEAQERFQAVSLEELVAGHGGAIDDVIERARSFGWDLSRPRAVLLASIDPPDEGAVPPNALATIAAAARATLGAHAIVWTRSATIAALIAPESDDPVERRQMADRLREELDHRLRTVNVSIGVGRRVASPHLMPRSFAEASRSVDVGRWAKGRHVTEVFDQLGLERLLASTPMEDLAEFVDNAIGALVAHDRANNTDLVETLAIWLETRNMAEAARRMHVHYNTMKNRLERIEAIVGPVATDASRALECEVAVYVARHYDVPWEAVPTRL